MRPDYTKMTRGELRAYVIKNRQDEEAIEYLIKTASISGKGYHPCPTTEAEMREQQEIITAKIKELDSGNDVSGNDVA